MQWEEDSLVKRLSNSVHGLDNANNHPQTASVTVVGTQKDEMQGLLPMHRLVSCGPNPNLPSSMNRVVVQVNSQPEPQPPPPGPAQRLKWRGRTYGQDATSTWFLLHLAQVNSASSLVCIMCFTSEYCHALSSSVAGKCAVSFLHLFSLCLLLHVNINKCSNCCVHFV